MNVYEYRREQAAAEAHFRELPPSILADRVQSVAFNNRTFSAPKRRALLIVAAEQLRRLQRVVDANRNGKPISVALANPTHNTLTNIPTTEEQDHVQ